MQCGDEARQLSDVLQLSFVAPDSRLALYTTILAQLLVTRNRVRREKGDAPRWG
jgi:hypothetical protein